MVAKFEVGQKQIKKQIPLKFFPFVSSTSLWLSERSMGKQGGHCTIDRLAQQPFLRFLLVC